MHTSTTTDSSKGRPAAKTRARSKKNSSPETLHIKTKASKEPVAIPADAGASGEVDHMIATAAYFLAQHRSFKPGHELEDWLTAERQIRTPNG